MAYALLPFTVASTAGMTHVDTQYVPRGLSRVRQPEQLWLTLQLRC